MSQRVHRTIVACVALVGCDPPAPKQPAPSAPVETPAPTPASPPTDGPSTPAEPVESAGPDGPAAAVEPARPARPPPVVAPSLEQMVARGINDLTIDLQRRLAREPGNVFVSGMSLSVALAMVHAGSDGATAEQLADLLHFTGPTADLHAGYAGLAARWNRPDKYVTLVTASRLFGARQIAFKPAYLDLTRTVFDAPLEPLDFVGDAAGARDRINGWVRTQTRDEIGELMPAGSIDAATRLVLADAAYFKADWLEPFDAAATATHVFSDREIRHQVPMMRSVQRLRVAYGKAGKLRVLELPYRGGDYSMVIILPGSRDALPAIEKSFNFAKLQSWLDAAKPTAVELKLPRFSLDSDLDLTPVLGKLGAAGLLNPKRADLGGMTDEPLALTAVRQRARITVEERGAEATAATTIDVSVGGLPSDPVPFIVDRPFLFYIRDVRTGALLFFGRVVDPTRAPAAP